MQRSAIRRIWLPALVSLLCAGMVTGQARADDPTIAAVGDMGCSPYDPSYNGGAGTATACRQRYVSDLLVDPALVALLDLGDNQYDNGELANYWAVYNPTFGRANAIVYPSLGNADYGTPNAQGFFDYFSAVGVTARITGGSGDASHFPGAAYYSFDIGAWHVIALNSNCADVGGCDAGSPQEQWLKSDLAAHPNHCTLAYWHHPRWNSGMLGNDPSTAAFWTDLYNAGADIVLNGHANHHYERFGPQNPAGAPDLNEGIREFIVSTGGQSHGAPLPAPNNPATSEVSDYTSFGVLKLTLHPTGYDWRFVPAAGGTFTDFGSGTCHDPPAPAPPAPAPPAPAQAPAAPSLRVSSSNRVVRLSWTAAADGGAPISGYNLYRGTTRGHERLRKHLGAMTTAYRDRSVTNGRKYYYRLAAVNNVGEGALSREVSATPRRHRHRRHHRRHVQRRSSPSRARTIVRHVT
jgi:acid phosphatase type 7